MRPLVARRDGGLKALFESAPWKPVKERLRVEAGDKCAYCESPVESQYGDVEHLRPKTGMARYFTREVWKVPGV